MNVNRVLPAFALLLALGTASVFGAEATKKEAVAMVDKGIKFVKTNGKEKAFAAFQDTSGEFFKGELYLFGYDTNGVCVVQGQKPKLVGKNRLDVADVNGKKYIQELVNLAKTKGNGWVDYLFQNPESKKIEPKITYCQMVAGADYFLACGIYNIEEKPEQPVKK